MADWPVYGHDLANTRDAGVDGPSASQLTQAWVFRSSTGDFTGTPVVARNSVVAGSNSGYLYALNARTGRLLWSYADGKYSPVVADAKRLYLVGYARLYGLIPSRARRASR